MCAFSLVVAHDLLEDTRIDDARSRQLSCFCLFPCPKHLANKPYEFCIK